MKCVESVGRDPDDPEEWKMREYAVELKPVALFL